MTHELKGQRILITGASSGIGEEFARQFAAMGADLVIAARRLDRLQKLASELHSQHGVRVEVFESDLSLPGAAEKLFRQATALHHPITLLINNAGIGKWNEFWEPPMVDHLATMQVNMVAPTELAHFCIRHMLEHKKPSQIVNVASIAAFQPVEGFAVYAGTKAYLHYFSEILDAELAQSNICVTCFAPGGTLTEFTTHAGQKVTANGEIGMMKTDKAVRIAIRGILRKKRLIIPGFMNKLAAFIPRLLPRRWSLWIGTQVFKQAVVRA